MMLLAVAVGLGLVMTAAWVCQRATRNIGWVDVFWTFGTGAAGVVLALAWSGGGGSARRWLAVALAGTWAIRLGFHVASRVAGSPEDGRYREIREAWGVALQRRLFGFLQLQALVSVALAAAIGLAAGRPGRGLLASDLIGALVGVVAMLGEAVADRQLRRFAADPANRGKVCDQGLWRLSRHPNYVCEWLVWLAYPIIAVDPSGGYPQGWWALAAPALMFWVLRFGTGVPPLEAHMLRTRGDAFRAYQARTPIFLPYPFRPRKGPRP